MNEEKRWLIRRLFSFIIITCLLTSCYAMTVTAVYAESLSGTIIVGGSMSSSAHVTVTDTFYANNLNCVGLNGARIVYYAPVYETSSVSGFMQTVNNHQITADPAPTMVSDVQTDSFGNHYKKYEWSLDGFTGSKTINVKTEFDATSTGNPAPDVFTEPRPSSVPSGMYQYINPTSMVQSTSGEIVGKAGELVAGASTEAEAVDRIMNFVRTSIPTQGSGTQKDAISSLHSSSGTCVNRANLALGLLRAANIPARYVNGIVNDNPPYKVPIVVSGSEGYAQFQWGKELHAWVEVYYPQQGVWVAYDPWLNKGFVDQRHVKTGTALDSNMKETSTGGFIETYNYENVNAGATGSITTTLQFSGVSDSGSYTFRSLSSNPAGVLMIGRDMVNTPTPTPTTTPIATVTPTPQVNVTITPTPIANGTVTPTPMANASPVTTATPDPINHGAATGNATLAGTVSFEDGKTFFITGVVMDEKTGLRINDATVLVDKTPVKIDDAGAFTANVTMGNHTVDISAPGYGNGSIQVTVLDKDVPVILKMEKSGTAATGRAGFPSPVPGFEVLVVLAGIMIGALYRHGRT